MPRASSDIPEYDIHDIPGFMKVVQNLTGSEKVLYRGQRHQWELKAKLGRIKPRNGTLLETEKQMLSEFKRKSVPWLPSVPTDDLEWLALAQHHGLATRLMDWTENPLTGLWFAVRNPPEKQDGDAQPGVVWCLKVPEDRILPQEPKHDIEKDVFSAKKTMVYRPRHISARIAGQAGWFTVHHYITKEKRFGVLELHPIFKGSLTKINIPGDHFPSLRKTLASMGTNDATLFPDLVGLCDQIERDHSMADDENPSPKKVKKAKS
jgi:hypothetical protein